MSGTIPTLQLSLDDSRLFIRRLAWAVYDYTCARAVKGQRTPCAAGFYEYARDIGPVTFLLNTDGVLATSEVQPFGRCVARCE